MKRRRPSEKQLLKARERFQAALTAYIVGKGARPGRFYDHEIDTPAGLLHITVYGSWIATRFDDVALGRAFTETCGSSSNPYSGKWNHHFGDGTVASYEPDSALAHFGYYFERLLAFDGAMA